MKASEVNKRHMPDILGAQALRLGSMHVGAISSERWAAYCANRRREVQREEDADGVCRTNVRKGLNRFMRAGRSNVRRYAFLEL